MSKSGSKALSKSVDSAVKSVVKSVESVVTSVLPKNMNMKHVLLAILVGLLLCMLFSNTVEGFGRGTNDYTNPPSGYCYNYTGNKGTQNQCVPKIGAPDTITQGEFCKNNTNDNYTVKPQGSACPAGTADLSNSEQTTTFCAAFNEFTENANSDGMGCVVSGADKYCKSELSENTDIPCNLNDKKCPGSLNLDESLTQKDYLQGQMVNCKWQDCSEFATTRDEVESAFSAPGLDQKESIKKWAKCIEKGPNTWSTMKTDSVSNNGDAWTSSTGGARGWGIGSPTGTAYGANTRPGATDLSILKPLIYRGDGGSVTAFGSDIDSTGMFPSDLWKTELDKKIKFCGASTTQNLEDKDYSTDDALSDGAVIGWDHSKSKFICLNNNPAVYTEVTQKRVDVVKANGCGDPTTVDCPLEDYCDGKCACTAGEAGPTDSALQIWADKCPDSNQLEVATTQITRELRGVTTTARNTAGKALTTLAGML